ncbi:hypothetical protein MBEHAL_0698 [Halarchaeum acidiphilum MH1-52-1]|uniref:DUF373 family protein n=1 Tax=Halarchaeum acidiphilum MH1-52-1 TaxID=1261545 RepID=U3AAZ8_9EURY|nr:hypothetical protein MBEHAL_0698 [Halarchaeum acidiphilum MH1-52-1]
MVVCVDRAGDVARSTGVTPPVVGREAVESLVIDLGQSDPADSSVNCFLEALRVGADLGDGPDDTVVAVVSGTADTAVGADRALAEQLDALVAAHDPDSAVVVVDTAGDERVVPIVESRLPVDAVDRVVVRQARDIESTYYLLKQFLADEELRESVLVPLGVVLLVFPILLTVTASLALAVASITAVLGAFLLYKGLNVDERLQDLSSQARDALYSGRVSIVTYVIAVGLTLVGAFAGALGVSGLSGAGAFVAAMTFVYHSVPWLALAALAGATGRLIDEFIREEALRASYLNLPFGTVAVGLVVRGFSAYFVEQAGVIPPVRTPALPFVAAGTLAPEERLTTFVLLGVLVSLVGIRVSSRVTGESGGDETP